MTRRSLKSSKEKIGALKEYLLILREDLTSIESGKKYRVRVISAILRVLLTDPYQKGGLLMDLKKMEILNDEPFLKIDKQIVLRTPEDFLDQQIISMSCRKIKLTYRDIINNESQQNGLAHEARMEIPEHVFWKSVTRELAMLDIREKTLVYAGCLVLDYGNRVLKKLKKGITQKNKGCF